MQKNHVSWLAGAGLLLIAVGLFGAFYATPRFLKSMIIESTVLKDDSDALKRWTVMPAPMFYKIYLFHVTNPEAVDRGERPVLVEKGPYHYDVYRERVDVQFHPEDDTVSYFDKSNFVFNKAKSGCFSDDDSVTLLNAPIVGTGLLLEKMMPMALSVFNEALPYLTQNKTKGAFITAKVRDILFDGLVVNCSYPETLFPIGPVCAGLKSKAPVTFRQNPGSPNFYFSMLSHMNGTSKDRVRINRGQKDFTLLGKIVSFRNSTTIDMWRPNSPCNMVNGTDTTIFRPFVDRKMKLPIFQSASCRSMYATYEYDSSYAGISTLHFIADPNMLASGRDYPPNRCFCPVASDDDDSDEDEDSKGGNKGGGGAGNGGGGGGGGGSADKEQSAEEGGDAGGGGNDGETQKPKSAEGGGGGGDGGGEKAAAEEGGGDDGGGDGGEKAAAEEEGGGGGDTDPVELVGDWAHSLRIRRAAKAKKTPDERDAKPCLLQGCLDVSKCFGSPVIISFPHFYRGDPKYIAYPIGLKPNKEKHETFLEMEPITGTPIKGSKRIQLNMNVKRVEEVSMMKTVSEGMFPMLWVEEGVVLEGNNLQMVVAGMRWVRVLLATPWVLVGVGTATLTGAALLFAHITGKIVLPGLNIASATDSRRGLDSGFRGGREVAPLPQNNYGYGQQNFGAQRNKALILGVTESAPMNGIPTRYITGADGNALLNGGGNGFHGNNQGGGMANVQSKTGFNNNSVLIGVDGRMLNAYGRGVAPPYMMKGSKNGAAAVYASGFLVQRKPTHGL